jgi:hypothetical protein
VEKQSPLSRIGKPNYANTNLITPVNNPLIAIDKNTKTKAGRSPATVFLCKSMKNLQED